MNKSESFRFYSDKFLEGTSKLSFEDRGKYITLLAFMHLNGKIKYDEIIDLVGELSEELKEKFLITKSGLWYNKRLEKEAKRLVVKAPAIFNDLKNIFMDAYLKKNKEPFYWNTKDAVALNKIIDQIIFRIKHKGLELIDENIKTSFFLILEKSIEDKYINENFNLSIINLKINDIISKIKSKSTNIDELRESAKRFFNKT